MQCEIQVCVVYMFGVCGLVKCQSSYTLKFCFIHVFLVILMCCNLFCDPLTINLPFAL
jgi:hypothetical protein